MEYTLDNIGQWVAELAEKPKITQFHTYARILRDKERQEAEKAILDKFDKNNAWFGAKDVTIINDSIAVITFTSRKSETHYIPVVHGNPSNMWFKTFEGAMLGTISILKTGDPEAAQYAAKLLDVEV